VLQIYHPQEEDEHTIFQSEDEEEFFFDSKYGGEE